MENEKVTIVIPVFNTPVEAFQRCICSVRNQLYTKIEIIVIDDGSENKNSQQYKDICAEDKRVLYKKTVNGGVSSARNTGVQIATGRYIAFVDADDTVKEDFIQQAYIYASEYDADMVVGLIQYIPETAIDEQNIPSLLLTENQDDIIEYMFYMEQFPEYRILGAPCGRLYKAETAKTISFDVDVRYFEDQLFNRHFISVSKRVVLVPEYWYSYYQNEYSAMHAPHKKWDQMQSYASYWNKWEKLNEKEKDNHRRTKFTKKNMGFYYYAVQEGVLAGEKYNRNKMRSLMDQYAFTNAMKYLRCCDYFKLQNRIKFVLMKKKCTFLIYLYIRIKILCKKIR